MARDAGSYKVTALAFAALAALAGARGALAQQPAALVLDGAAAHHAWDSFGGLSAGASSRLLFDYPAPQLADILDLLYKPAFGAALQICKIEIGGDDMSTDGTEASHMHSRGDLSCDRGYELRLAREAVSRNPKIKTFALSWGVPGWIGNGTYFSQENMDYQSAFASCFLEKVGRASTNRVQTRPPPAAHCPPRTHRGPKLGGDRDPQCPHQNPRTASGLHREKVQPKTACCEPPRPDTSNPPPPTPHPPTPPHPRTVWNERSWGCKLPHGGRTKTTSYKPKLTLAAPDPSSNCATARP